MRSLRRSSALAIVLTYVVAVPALCTAAEQQFSVIGDFRTESGDTLRECRVGYRTYGTLDADNANIVIFPTWFTGTTADLERAGLIGPGALANTDRFFVIAIDALANGVSCSPSNSEAFPAISTTDMVNSQHRLLTSSLGITHVHAVIGISMGGMQTFAWLANYPSFMDKAVPVDGSPQMTSFDLVQWQTHSDIVRTMRAGGSSDGEIRRILSRVGLLSLYTPEYFVENVSPAGLGDFVSASDASYATLDLEDYVAQLRAMIDHDVLNGDGARIHNRPAADVLIVGVPQDHMVNQATARQLAVRYDVEYYTVDSACGHVATTSCEQAAVVHRVNEFLEN
jgi:homoserine O-acetyltransferase